MTKKEFLKEKHSLMGEENVYLLMANNLRNRREKLQESYARECFERSPYTVGQKIEEGGQTFFVSGAWVNGDGRVYLSVNYPKKDGTMSKRHVYGKVFIPLSD